MIPWWQYALRYGVGLAMATYVLRQARKPDRLFGRVMIRAMNQGHSRMTDWGLSQVTVGEGFAILDVGCGGGRTVQRLASMTRGRVDGIDYAEGSIAASLAHNADLIKAGRVAIAKASVSKLPFPDNQFDLVTAVETQYYWPDLPGDMREVLRVLKPGGELMVIAETYKGGRFDALKAPVMWLLGSSHLSANDQRELFLKAGYQDVQITQERKRGWICVIGRKP